LVVCLVTDNFGQLWRGGQALLATHLISGLSKNREVQIHKMTLSLNKHKLDNLANEIWKSAERLRGKFKAYEYQNVILPIIVIRRLECVLIKWREEKKAEIRAKQPKRSEKELDELVKKLELNPALAPFSNKTNWTLRKIYEEDHTLLEKNFRAYKRLGKSNLVF
jgi:type I restriction enzyme M protein